MTAFKVSSLLGNRMRLDGGAMFGNVPKALWKKWAEPDPQNCIEIGSNILFIETGKFKVLFETGTGAFLPPEMKHRFGVENRHVLLESLAQKGYAHEDITHVILSHLHFDHAGGLLAPWEEGGNTIRLLFPNALFYVGKANLERSLSPHVRDRASFIPGLAERLEESGRLSVVTDKDTLDLDGLSVEFMESQGHTPGMILSRIRAGGLKLLFAGDIAPGHAWINLSVTMGYDRFPERLIDEKRKFLGQACEEKTWIFYPHDPSFPVSRLSRDPASGRFFPVDLTPDLNLLN